jgi:hypothetical protein
MTEHDSTIEIWKPVVGWEGRYEVSNFGRVKRLAGAFKYKPSEHILTTRVLSARIAGYPVVTLSGGRGKDQQSVQCIHRLVVAAFVAPVPRGLTVNHIDGVKTNNRLDNLEIASQKRQYAHSIALGLWTPAKGSQKSKIGLSEALVAHIRARYVRGCDKNGVTAMAKELGINRATLFSIVHRRSWKHVP